MLDPIHHQGLRLVLGAFRTSPSESLLAEANEPPLYNRRLKLSMQYALKLKSNPSNPTYETVFEPQYKTLFENKPNMIPSFGIRISSEFENMNLDLDNIADFKVSGGWSGGAKVLGKHLVPGRPTSLGDSRARAYCASSRCGWGLFRHFFPHLSFLFSFSLSLGDGPI